MTGPGNDQYSEPVRWEALFEDLESQLDDAARSTSDAEISERSRIDFSAITLAERMRGQIGQEIGVRVRDTTSFAGRLERVGADWLVLESGTRSVLLPAAAIDYVERLGRPTGAPVTLGRAAPTLASALRVLARDRAEVLISLPGGESARQLNGIVDRVGRDYCEVAVTQAGEMRRHRNVAAVLAIPFTALLSVSWLNGG